ncbi:LysM domain-containing protein [Streptomyces sp. KhCrAH-43]|uniref:LysM peptidoglycan-binding domain-containing protein n=1 Tax=unclassified Streptomyces TaxID=2593676 RepID=UPI000364735A|nr:MULTISPECIES: LysM peptidoglycan-binding domain-containing protein [unclassified Streptomyces]MYS39624.1 LysM peptidoglycan-binding domain-containing protein [Streptomyces sp. SID4920]MYX64304.1 LysM peptidoglycan-binding domain-containing protein [Streptomyces sp. SID8373]RAJ48629.1 LysM domain-containing protein [Streptomyces sp. KhCrAH-43]
MHAASRLSTWARALASAAALVLLVAGAPWLLLRAGALPSHIPSASDVGDTLTAADDGHVLFTVLTLAAWALWVWFLVSLLIEAASLLRRVKAPRIRGFGSAQRLAGVLLGGLLMLPSATALAATPAAATPAVATTHVPQAAATPDVPTQKQAAGAVHIVGATGETVWDLAEQYLGDGTRYAEIKALNPDLAHESFLGEGTTVRLPADARTSVSAATAVRPQGNDERETGGSYTVQPGDTLWDISEDQQGDPTRYPEIVKANPDVIQDPDLIYPGEQLSIPGQQAGVVQQPSNDGSDRQGKPDQHGQDDGDAAARPSHTEAPRASDGEAGTPEEEVAPTPSASSATPQDADSSSATPPSQDAGRGTPSETAPSETTGSEKPSQSGSKSSATTRSAVPEDEESDLAVAAMALGAAGFVAAGVLLMLRRRRTVQQRRRRPRHRIPMPSGRAAATEHSLRCVDAIGEVEFLDAALRTLAHHCAEADRPLPALAAVQLGTEGALLHIAGSEDGEEPPMPLAPFTAVEDSPHLWWCPAGTADLADAAVLGQMDAPYPALVALGDDTREALLLVDLERFGALHLTGEIRLPVLRALGTSLAVSPLSTDLEIAVAGEDCAPGLSLVDSCVTPYATLGEAADVVRTHHERQQRALSESDVADLGAARAADSVDELWPMVVLADLDSCPDPEAAEELAAVLQQEPRTATAIVTSGHLPAAADGVWALDTDDDVHPVPGTTLLCRLVAFSDDVYADVVENALTSSSESDVAPAEAEPVVDPVVEAHGAPGPAPEPAPAAGRADGLFARLADLEDGGPAVPPHPFMPPEPDSVPESDTGAKPFAKPAGTAAPLDDASSPSRIVLPAVAPAIRVSARLPEGELSPQPARALPVPDPVRADEAPEASAGQTAAAGPVVRVLGPVEVTGAEGHIDSNRRTVATELVSWLALRDVGATRHELDEVIAPGGGRVENNTRNGRVREVRRWLGDAHYPKLNEQPDRKHRLVDVACDWRLFQDLTQQAAGADSNAERHLLRQALELVRGRPFTGIPPRRYAWAQTLTQDMVSAIVDAADDLAVLCLDGGDAEGALWAAGRGLDSGREREVLWRHRFEALAQLGAHDDLETAIRQLEQYLLDAGLTMESETEETIRRLDAVRR